ncbi:MAG: pitrilysin family protein [Gemmatimonas sp.]
MTTTAAQSAALSNATTTSATPSGGASILTPRNSRDALAWQQTVVREVLPNGLTLLIRRDTTAPVVAIVTHVKAGYFDETDDIVGIAHVLEHMYFKGTPTRGVGAIARETKANGGYLNAHTIYDHTSYYTVLPSASFMEGLGIQFDAFANSVIDADELARELEVIIQEAHRKRDSAGAVSIESLYALLHDRHRIRRWRIGEDAPLRALTRTQLMSFYKHWYQPSNTVLSIVGDVDPDFVRRAVIERYGALPAGNPQHIVGPQETAAAPFRIREWSGDIAQTQLALGWRTPALHHPDTPLLDMAGTAIGTGRASRLYRAVRERGLASSVGAYNYTAGDVGVFVVHAETPPEHAREALLQVWQEVLSARDNGVRRSEIARAQSIIEARWLRRLESMDGQASYLASWEANGGLELAANYYDRLMSLTAADVEGAMARHLQSDNVSIIAYRPDDALELAASAGAVRALLQEVDGAGSSVLAPPANPTPAAFPAIKATASQTTADAGMMEGDVHVFRTTRGVPVLVHSRQGALIVNVGVFIRGGASVEAEGLDGLARLVVQTSLKGTPKRTGARIAEAAEELGGSIAASAGLESVGWSMSVPTRHLPLAVELLADVVQNAEFAIDAIETERRLAVAEVERMRDDMYRWPMRIAMQAAYPTHAYAHAVIGTEASLPLITADQVRDYHANSVLRGPAVIVIVGDVTAADAARIVAREFTKLEWRDDVAPAQPQWPSSVTIRTDERQKQQTALGILFEGPGRLDPARHASQVLSVIASGLGGRFFEQLRDKQSLAYTVSAYGIERRSAGLFAAYIATAPERENEARIGLLAEFAKLRAAPVSADELQRAITYLVGTHAIAQQSGASVMADIVDAWLFGTGLAERHAFVADIQRVTAQDVQALAQQYFNPERRVEGLVRGVGVRVS